MALTGNALPNGQVLIFDFPMDVETSPGQSLVDVSSNMTNAATFGGSFPAIINGFNTGGPGTGNARQFGAAVVAYGYENLALQSLHNSNYITLEVLVWMPFLPSGAVDVVGLYDATGTNEILGIGVGADGKATITYYDAGSASHTITSSSAIFPQTNWVHMVAQWNPAASTVALYVANPVGVAFGSPVASSGGVTLNTGVAAVLVHNSTSSVFGIDRPRCYASSTTHVAPLPYQVDNDNLGNVTPPPAGVILAGTTMVIVPTSSAGCTAELTVVPQQVLNTDGTPQAVGVGDALNPANWSVTAADGQVNPIVEVIKSQLPSATAGLWFDLTFQLPLDAGVQYQVQAANLVAAGDASIPDGSLIQASSANFVALALAIQVTTPQQTLYGIDIANPPSVGDYVVDGTGDYGIDSGTDALQKRIFRRLDSPPNGFTLLPGYGIGVPGLLKQLQTNNNKRQLIERIQKNVALEPGVQKVAASLVPLPNGLVLVHLEVQTASQVLSLNYQPRT